LGSAVVNSTSQPVVTLIYETGNQVGNPQTKTGLASNRTWILNYWTGNLPGSFVGNAAITSDQPVAALVNTLHSGSGDTNASYTVPNR
jgi:hypothetical protein